MLDLARINHAIEALGFVPRVARLERGTLDSGGARPDEIPEPIASALAEAHEKERMVLVDFYADWCAPCKTLEAEVMPLPAVSRALRSFVVLRVDTDRFPEATRSYNVVVMPTLLVLDARGVERARIAGIIEAEGLVAQLEKLGSVSSSPGIDASSDR